MYTIRTQFAFNSLLHESYLLRQVANSNFNRRVVLYAAHSESSSVTSDVQQVARIVSANDVQCLVKRMVRIVMVKTKPRLLYLFGQTAQPLIYRRPIAEMFESNGFTLLERLVQDKPTFVVDIMIEINISTYHLITQQKPTNLS